MATTTATPPLFQPDVAALRPLLLLLQDTSGSVACMSEARSQEVTVVLQFGVASWPVPVVPAAGHYC